MMQGQKGHAINCRTKSLSNLPSLFDHESMQLDQTKCIPISDTFIQERKRETKEESETAMTRTRA